MRFDVSSASTDVRARINAYKAITTTETYYIPYCVYDVHETFNPGNDEGCSFELYKAYTEKEIEQIK